MDAKTETLQHSGEGKVKNWRLFWLLKCWVVRGKRPSLFKLLLDDSRYLLFIGPIFMASYLSKKRWMMNKYRNKTQIHKSLNPQINQCKKITKSVYWTHPNPCQSFINIWPQCLWEQSHSWSSRRPMGRCCSYFRGEAFSQDKVMTKKTHFLKPIKWHCPRNWYCTVPELVRLPEIIEKRQLHD